MNNHNQDDTSNKEGFSEKEIAAYHERHEVTIARNLINQSITDIRDKTLPSSDKNEFKKN